MAPYVRGTRPNLPVVTNCRRYGHKRNNSKTRVSNCVRSWLLPEASTLSARYALSPFTDHWLLLVVYIEVSSDSHLATLLPLACHSQCRTHFGVFGGLLCGQVSLNDHVSQDIFTFAFVRTSHLFIRSFTANALLWSVSVRAV